MEDFQKRMVKEFNELKDKQVKLGNFINDNPKFAELNEKEQQLQREQYDAMTAYLNALASRFANQGITPGMIAEQTKIDDSMKSLAMASAVERQDNIQSVMFAALTLIDDWVDDASEDINSEQDFEDVHNAISLVEKFLHTNFE